MLKISTKALWRVLDANFNRAKEALRVCEDVSRFVMDAPKLTSGYKKVRHGLNEVLVVLGKEDLLRARDIVGDVGRKTTGSESRRADIKSIFYANSQRAKESLRVLEECTKLLNIKTAERLKRLRYTVYDLEKEAFSQL